MSVLIKDMKMPKDCVTCLMCDKGADGMWYCVATMTNLSDKLEDMLFFRPDWCPLVEVPIPHGDLIDRWELTETAMIDPDEGKYVAVYRADEVDEAPVVIEAEE